MSQRKKPWSTYIVLGAILFMGFMVYKMLTSATNNSVVNLVLQKEGKTFLYSYMNAYVVENSIDKKESPVVFPFLQIFEEDDKLYVAPDKLKDIINLLCGNYQIHEYLEKSTDGYVTSGTIPCFQISSKNQTTEKIGEQIQVYTVKLTHLNSGDSFNIKWSVNTKTRESKALENCHEKSFMIKTSVQPGEFAIASEDFVMVDLQEVINFYEKKIAVTLNKEEQLLYIGHKN